MHRFISSFRLPLVTALLLAVVTVMAYVLLKPTGLDIGNAEILRIAKIAGWGIGPVFGIILLVLIGILNLARRIIGLRKVFLLNAPVVLMSVFVWVMFSWQLLGEPRYTPLARAVIDFAARPLLWGTGIALLFALLMTILSFFVQKKS